MLKQSRTDVAEFKELQTTFQLSKDKEKLAKQAQKEALRQQKQAKEKKGRPSDLAPIVEADSDIMAMMQRGGTSQYDQGMGGLYGYG